MPRSFTQLTMDERRTVSQMLQAKARLAQCSESSLLKLYRCRNSLPHSAVAFEIEPTNGRVQG
jgi:hypothetical protein